jgi:hypothetical protein
MLERVGLGKREAVTSTAPIPVLGHLTAEGVGEVRDTLDPVVRKERLEPGRRGAHRFDEETRLVAGVLVAEPPLPGCREPALVTSKVVPVGDAHDCVVSGLIDIPGSIDVTGSVRVRGSRGEVGQRGSDDRGRLAL